VAHLVFTHALADVLRNVDDTGEHCSVADVAAG
jgi:hypothetical protein